jgi:predicted ATPase/DNA-binding CsgD family transcriptional regulator
MFSIEENPIQNLPQYATSFVGRLTEITEITNRLNNPNCRLLCLVGPGGIGKTRLAIQVAANWADQFDDGVCFVPLQPLNSPNFMVSIIADAVGFQFYPGGDPKKQLLDYLREKGLLLVLDNLEHLLEGAGLLSEILHAASQVRILATSRERLNLREEWVFDVRELKYPISDVETDIEEYDSVQLFVQHARRVQADFALTSLQKPAVIRICRLVGGIPLGIELAAAWVRVLSYEEIAREIERSLDILETRTRNIEPRHRNIRAAFEPMWNRLSGEQQAAFKKLSRFRGGFSREAAEYVAGASLGTLSTLVDRSLVWMDASGRYDLHELLKQYADERLNETAGELKNVCEWHCRYFTAFLAQKEKDLEEGQQKEALEDIQSEIDNIRAAWQWGIEHKREAELDKACRALWFFYDTRSWYREGEQAFRAAAEALSINDVDEEKTVVLGKILTCYGSFCFSLNKIEDARNLLEESLSILRRHHALTDVGFALLRLSEVAMFLENDPLSAQGYLRESLTIFQAASHRWGIAYSLRWLGFAAFHLEEFEDGKRLAQQGLAIYQGNGDQWGVAITLSVVGFCMFEQGEFAESKRVGQECVARCREIGLQWAILNGLLVIGAASCALKAYEEARQIIYEALELAVDHQLMIYILAVLEETAGLMINEGKREHAPAILAFVLHSPIPPLLGKRRTARSVAKLQADLQADMLGLPVEGSPALDLETAIAYCRDFLRPPAQIPQLLTRRELEILHLVADGLSNRAIARELIFSLGTVKWYLHQIYDKLGVGSRTQAIARAKELELLP